MRIKEENVLMTLIMDELMYILQTHGHQINRSTKSYQEQEAQDNARGMERGRNSSNRGSRGSDCSNFGQINVGRES